MRMRNSLSGAIMIAACIARAAAAQGDQGDRGGFTASIGTGISSAGISCAPQCNGDRQSGTALFLRVGGHISSQFTLGFEATHFRADIKTMTPVGKWSLTWYSVSSAWYPSVDDDFFLKLGLGIAATRADLAFAKTSGVALTASDFGAVVGIGKDFRFTDMLAFTTFANVLFSTRAQAAANGSNSGAKISADMIHLGAAISIP